MKEFLIVGVMLVTFIAACIYGAASFDAWMCHNKWADSGMQSRWNWTTNCQISPDGARWIPEERYREVNQ